MTPHSLQAVLRSLSGGTPTGDGELLRQFVDGDAEAFAEIVRRHGRLVWSVCRHLTGSDAEADDAFQGTFVVLLRHAGKIRKPGSLSSWLHGVAYRVCARARRSAKRRAAREQAATARERTASVVPDSAWDRALAAIHEEVGTLPDALRVPFVLCCLEGKGVTEAAEQLGWKLGTLSGRLTRAKDALVARLLARGLTLGAVAGVGLAAPPASALAKAAAVGRVGFVVPDSILQLTKGVLGMSIPSFKVLASVALLACGLVACGRWVAIATAQPPGPVTPGTPAAEPDPQTELRELRELELRLRELQRQRAVLEAKMKQKSAGRPGSSKAGKWEYEFVAARELSQAKFVDLLRDREHSGWEFNGTAMLTHEGKPTSMWVFRRPVAGQGTGGNAPLPGLPLPGSKPASRLGLGSNHPQTNTPVNPAAGDASGNDLPPGQNEKAAKAWAAFAKRDLPLEPTELAALLNKLAAKRYEPDRYSIQIAGDKLLVEGDKEFVAWATGLINTLAGKDRPGGGNRP